MRKIKFRAWDKEKCRWVREYDYQLEDQEDPAYEKEYDEDSGWLDGEVASDLDLVNGRLTIDRYVWEQFTGIKDKNDKEIYEGDIVKFADLELAMKPAGVVCFSDGKFFVKDWEFDDGSYHIVDFYDYNIPYRDFEVIGNIHENPELLGG